MRQLARTYKRKGHKILVVAPRWPRSLSPSDTVDGQTVLRLPMPMPSRHPRSLASFFLRFGGSVIRMLSIGWRWRPDVVHVHCVGPNGLYALILVPLLRLPLIVTSHGEQTMDATQVYERSAVQRWVLRRLLRRADAVSACSADALRHLEPYGPDGPVVAPSSVIHNGIDLSEFRQPSPASPHPRPYLLALGRHVWNKGFDVLLRAYAGLAPRYPAIDLIVAGDGAEHTDLIALARDLGIADRVVFPGRTDRAQTATLFHHALFFVLPSLQEPFGIVNLEAMAAGKAVIATRTGGVPEIVHDGQNGLLVPPADVDALARAMETLLHDHTYAVRLGTAGARLVAERYTWDHVSSSYLTLYERVLSRRAMRGNRGSNGVRDADHVAVVPTDRAVQATDARARHDLLCIGQEDWDEIWRRNQFLLTGLAATDATARILFVERPCDLTHGLRTRAFMRPRALQRAKLALALRGPRQCADARDLWLLTPFKLLPHGVPLMRRVNEWLERAQVKRALRALRMQHYVFWSQNPEAAHWLTDPAIAFAVYDATDDWSVMDGPPRWVDVVRRGQERLARQADVVLACSQALFDKWSRVNPTTALLPNGVEVAHYARTGQLPRPADVLGVPRPVLGYTGTLHDERVDAELVCQAAAMRPAWQFVFIGPDYLRSATRARLAALPNVHLLGPRPYRDLPAYMGLFDLCVIPHRVTAFTESLNPIKIYEYLATGLPIVSTPVATVRELPELVYLARDAREFVAGVEAALAEAGDEAPRRRRALAAENSWLRRVADVVAAIDEHMAGATPGASMGVTSE